jgi:DNA-binding ferritin-like protein
MHWIAAGPHHAFFGDVYGQMEGFFDEVAEKIIQTGGESELDLSNILSSVLETIEENKVPPFSAGNVGLLYQYFVARLDEILEMIEELSKTDLKQGELDMIAAHANCLEVLKYKSLREIHFA